MPELVVMTRYECVVHPAKRPRNGLPVAVYATSRQEAVNKAIAIGWTGPVQDGRVIVRRVEQVVIPTPPTTDAEEATEA